MYQIYKEISINKDLLILLDNFIPYLSIFKVFEKSKNKASFLNFVFGNTDVIYLENHMIIYTT